MAENTLSPAVAEKYKLVDHVPQKYALGKAFNHIEVDFRTMSLDQADKLVAKGFKGLVPKGSAHPDTAKSGKTESGRTGN